MRIHSWIWGAMLAVTATACASRQPSSPTARAATPQAHAGSPAGGGAMCPMMIDPATTQITTSDTDAGVQIVFTTSGDVNDLRERVRRMAAKHEQMAGMHGKAMGGEMQGGGMQDGMHGGGMQGGGMQGMHGGSMQGGEQGGMTHMEMVPSRATVEDVPGGARLLLVPDDPAQVAALRQHVRMHAAMMQKGQCPMMARPSQAPDGGHEQHHPGDA